MSRSIDPHYLKTEQYKDASNLNARVTIHQRFSTNSYGWMNWVFDHLLILPDDATILELGCGPAYLWQENASRIPWGWQITLSDLSPGMLDAAWRNLVVSGRAFQFKEIDAQSIPLEDNSFDAVIANHMLYHVPDRAKAIAEMYRVLKPGGHFFATTIGRKHLKEIATWLRQVSPGSDLESFGRPFSLENGLEQLKQYFPKVELSRYSDSLQVTEVEPIIAFLRSTTYANGISEERVAQLQIDLEKEIREKGQIFITKDSGLFEAIK
jgi:ubiquinone/menaquinone biosynthesis C-methylase UbiE